MQYKIIISISFLSLLPFVSFAREINSNVDVQLRKIIKDYNLQGQPILAMPKVDIKSPMAQLGKRLFFTTKLSGQDEVACVTCHHPILG